jgi:hypothetical protein
MFLFPLQEGWTHFALALTLYFGKIPQKLNTKKNLRDYSTESSFYFQKIFQIPIYTYMYIYI